MSKKSIVKMREVINPLSSAQAGIGVVAISAAVGIDMFALQILDSRSDSIAATRAQGVVLARANEMG